MNISMPTMTFMTKYYHNPTRRLKPVSLKTLIKFLPLFLALFVASCEEDPTTIGKGLLPGSDFVSLTPIDTVTVKSYTMYDAKVKTSNPTALYLGHLYDPSFGTTTAGFVTQLRLKYDWPGGNIIIDSMKLILQLENVQGVTDGINKLSFYEIANQIYTDSSYYSNDTVIFSGAKVTDVILPQLRADTVNNIVIKLPDTAFASWLMRDTSKLIHSNIKPDFRSFFKGLYFELNSGTDPLLLTLNPANDNTGFVLIDRYYKNFFVLYFHDGDGNEGSYYFIIDAINRNASFNKFTHDIRTATGDQKILHINDFFLEKYSYLQGLNGTYARLKIPGLEKLKSDPALKNAAINKARLTIPFYLDTILNKKSSVPTQLYLRYRTRNNEKFLVPDFSVDSYHTFFDGRVDTTRMVYNFNLPTYFQQYLEDASGDILPEIEVFQGAGTRNVILKTNDPLKPVKFSITYTIF
jgi:hypothetical protein